MTPELEQAFNYFSDNPELWEGPTYSSTHEIRLIVSCVMGTKNDCIKQLIGHKIYRPTTLKVMQDWVNSK